MNINLTLIAQMASFVVFVMFVMKYVWPPLVKAMEDRKAKIADGLAAAERGAHEKELAEQRGIYCHHYPICVRKILPDDTLISMASNADEVASSNGDIAATPPSGDAWYSITLTNYHRGRARNEFERLAKFLASSMSRLFEARPHWGKLCPMPPDELRELYPAFGRFARVCSEVDPHRKFSNAWTSELLDEVS